MDQTSTSQVTSPPSLSPAGRGRAGEEAASQFLRLCLRGRWDAASLQAARVLSQQNAVDWDALGRMAQAEGLAPLLYKVVRGQSLVPPETEQPLRNAYYYTAQRNLQLFHELSAILYSLEAENISVIALKGAGLAEAVYGNAAVRPLGDLDLLICREQAPAALNILGRLNYAPHAVEPHAGDTLAYESEVMLSKPGKMAAPIEVHWNLLDSPYYQRKLSMGWFWDTALPIQISGAPALVLGPEAQVLHLCAHLALHHSGERLLWLHDIAEVIVFYRVQIDWEQVLARAKAYDLVLPLQQILPKVADEWQVPISSAVLGQLRLLHPSHDEVRIFNWLTAKHRPVAQRFWADLSSTPDWKQKLHFAWNNLFPSPAYMRHRYHIPHPTLLPLYYPYRWLLGLRSALGLPTKISPHQPKSDPGN